MLKGSCNTVEQEAQSGSALSVWNEQLDMVELCTKKRIDSLQQILGTKPKSTANTTEMMNSGSNSSD
jgi:hypothetical protein